MNDKEKILTYGVAGLVSIGAGALIGYYYEKGIKLNESLEASLVGIPVLGNAFSEIYVSYKENRDASNRLLFPGVVRAGLEAGVGFALGIMVGKFL